MYILFVGKAWQRERIKKATGGKEYLGKTIFLFCETKEQVGEEDLKFFFLEIIKNRKNEEINFHIVKF